jgi:spermidine synthase
MVRPVLTLFAAAAGISQVAFSQVAPISVETPYNHITIEHFGSVVEMRSLWRTTVFRESAIDLSDLSHLMVPYTRFVAASAVFNSSPSRVLMIGLGGGGFNQFFEKAFPKAALDTVEIDPVVLKLAQQHMAFKTSEGDHVSIADGRMFLRRCKTQYDWIILDAFRGGYVPPHLKTLEFYRLAQAHLASNGIFVANVHNNTALFAADLRTMHAVFPQVGFFDVSGTGNAIVVGANFVAPSFQEIVKKAEPSHFNETFRRNVDLANIGNVFHVVGHRAHEDTAPVLTDDFAPTEFLEAVRSNNARH